MFEALMSVSGGPAPPPRIQLDILSSDDFTTASGLASLVGLSAGTVMNNTTDWLRITDTLLGTSTIIPKLPIRYSVSKANILTATPDNGSKIVTIAGEQYRVRLMTGATVNPTPEPYANRAGGEFNSIFYRVCSGRPANWTGEKLAEFTPVELGFLQTHGWGTIVREVNGPRAIYRGSQTVWNGIAATGTSGAGASTAYAWRPILIKV